jgi:hypothetical protein
VILPGLDVHGNAGRILSARVPLVRVFVSWFR